MDLFVITTTEIGSGSGYLIFRVVGGGDETEGPWG
jgi:hypothetical protein